jgi:hypothetical protein
LDPGANLDRARRRNPARQRHIADLTVALVGLELQRPAIALDQEFDRRAIQIHRRTAGGADVQLRPGRLPARES